MSCPECSAGFVCLTCRCAWLACADKWSGPHKPYRCPDCIPRLDDAPRKKVEPETRS